VVDPSGFHRAVVGHPSQRVPWPKPRTIVFRPTPWRRQSVVVWCGNPGQYTLGDGLAVGLKPFALGQLLRLTASACRCCGLCCAFLLKAQPGFVVSLML